MPRTRSRCSVTDNSGDDSNPDTVDAGTLGTSTFVIDSSHGHDTINKSDDVHVVGG